MESLPRKSEITKDLRRIGFVLSCFRGRSVDGIAALCVALLGQLFAAGASLKTADSAQPEGQTLLMLASRTGDVDAIRVLLDHDADVNASETRTGTTALMWAALANRAEAISTLVRRGAGI